MFQQDAFQSCDPKFSATLQGFQLGSTDAVLGLGTVASGEVVYDPQLNLTIYPDAVATGEIVYDPRIDLVIYLGTVGSGEAFFEPTVGYILQLGTVGSGEVVYSPTVQPGPVFLTLGTVDSAEAVYSPQLNLTIYPGAVASGEVVYQPQLNLVLYPGTVTTSETVYSPTLQTFVTIHPGTVTTSEEVFEIGLFRSFEPFPLGPVTAHTAGVIQVGQETSVHGFFGVAAVSGTDDARVSTSTYWSASLRFAGSTRSRRRG